MSEVKERILGAVTIMSEQDAEKVSASPISFPIQSNTPMLPSGYLTLASADKWIC